MLFGRRNMRETSALMFAKIIAALVLLICIGLAVRMVLPAAQRYRIDAFGRRLWLSVRRAWLAVTGWRRHRAMKKTAEAAAAEAIKRARAGSKIVDGEWDGNVYRPKSFGGKKRDKRDLH